MSQCELLPKSIPAAAAAARRGRRQPGTGHSGGLETAGLSV